MLAAGGYFGLFAILLAQALAGQPVLAPRGGVLVAIAVWGAVLTLGAVAVAGMRDKSGNGALPMMVSR
jgi:hypothetical protein